MYKDYMWIRVDKEGECPSLPCFISDEFENVYQAHCSFDYYDADYWFPMPAYPEGDE
jgi:hypothetical protein